jgi:hypothetical protein
MNVIEKRLEDGKMNSRGFSNPWDKNVYTHFPSAKTGNGNGDLSSDIRSTLIVQR